jgi:uncharacterized protein YyaL (SSP411 family)
VQIPWCEWTPLAFAQAEAEQKPVLVSLVTAWSEECAVMDQTTYEHADVVSLIDTRFVPIRVDADRRPDLNERYNLGGWPTTACLTHSGDILSGGTYLSADRMVEMLRHVADAYRDRRAEISARASAVRASRDARSGGAQAGFGPDSSTAQHFGSLLIDRFDPEHGGFGSCPKLPHPDALLFALSLADDADLSQVIDITLDRMSALWDPVGGGFYRYADAADWSGAAAEKTLEDNAALLHVYVEAAVRGRSRFRDRAAAIVQWVRSTMADRANGGFYNVQTPTVIDETMYVDRNAMMVGAFIRAAALFDDIWLRDFALKSLEAVIVPAYKPGDGVAHAAAEGSAAQIRGLLTDQVHVASALIWAHAATGQLPYSMLALELMEFAVRTMWDGRTDSFRDRVEADDPVVPFELNCHAACVLDRLALLTGDRGYHDRARAILQSLAVDYSERDLFGAAYALAVREVIDRHPPAGLELSKVDWQ